MRSWSSIQKTERGGFAIGAEIDASQTQAGATLRRGAVAVGNRGALHAGDRIGSDA
jgi:hypothetical protein